MYGLGLVVKLALGFFVWLRAYDGTRYKLAKVNLVRIPPRPITRIPLTYRLKSCGTKLGVRYAINFNTDKKNKGQSY